MHRKKIRNLYPNVAVAYVRVSTAEQALGIEAQQHAIERHASMHGLTIASWHIDHGVSGGTPVDDRPGLCNAFADMERHGAAILLAHRRDRIARDVVIAATVEKMAQTLGGRVVTADGVAADDTPEAALMRTLIDAMAMYERSVIRARIRAAVKVKRTRGECLGTAPLGMAAGPDGKLTIDPAEQSSLEMVRTLTHAGLTQREICSALELGGHKPRGERWHPTTIARIQRAFGLGKAPRGPYETKKSKAA